MQSFSRYIIHPSYLRDFIISGEDEIDMTITRLSYITQPQLQAFFGPLEYLRNTIEWANEDEHFREVVLYRQAMRSLHDGSEDNRDQLLYALAQIVKCNLPKLVKAYRKGMERAFMKLVENGSARLGDLLDLGLEDEAADIGLFALCRIGGTDPDSIYTLPAVIREAMGMKVTQDTAAVAPVKKRSLKVYNIDKLKIVALMPTAASKIAAVADFLITLSPGTPTAGMVKSLRSMTGFPALPEPPGTTNAKMVPVGRSYLLVEKALRSHYTSVGENRNQIGTLPFHERVRALVKLMHSDGEFCLRLLDSGLKNIIGLNHDIKPEGLAKFCALLIHEIKHLRGDGWCCVEGLEGKLDFDMSQLISSFRPSGYNAMRPGGSPYGSHPRIDLRLDLKIPAIRYLLVVFCAYGLVDLGLGEEPTVLRRRSQYDSVSAFQLTPLGEYAMGCTDQVPEYEPFEVEKCRLDPKYPFIYVPAELSEIYGPFVRKFATPIGTTRYAVSESSFRKGVRRFDDLNERMVQFRDFAPEELPAVWEDLINRISDNASAVTETETYYKCLTLDRNNADLMDYVMHSEFIGEYCKRGQDYTLFVPVNHLDTLINDMAAHGFYLR